MPDPVAEARNAAWELLRNAARRLGSEAVPDPASIRFRVDGRGGELASPFPMTARLDPDALADAAVPGIWFEAVFPSGGWIGLNLSERWRDAVRCRPVESRPADVHVPPTPSFPARIRPEDWRIDCLLGAADPLLAARLDRKNPARQIELCLCRAGENRGKNRRDRELVCECAQLLAAWEAEDPEKMAAELWKLSGMYLAHPGEDAVTARLVRVGRESLL